MSTRNLEKNQKKTAKALERIEKQAMKSIAKDYRTGLDLIRAELLKRIESFGKLDNKTLSKFDRRDKLVKDIISVVNSMQTKVNKKIRRNSDIQVKQGYFRNSWCIDQALGVKFKWRIRKDSFKQI